MTIAAHTRALLQVLRHRYGVTDAEPGHGGNHPFIRFTDPRTGKRHRLTLGHDTRRGAMNMKHQDLRRLLGPPLARVDRDKRTMEEMMQLKPFNPALPELNLPAEALAEVRPHAMTCRVAMYSSEKSGGRRLRFNVPVSLAVGGWRGVGFKVDGPDTWELWDDPRSKKRWRSGDLAGHLKVDVLDPALPDERFGSSPAEVVEVDGHLFVSCPREARVPLSSVVKEAAKAKIEVDLSFGPNHRERMLAVLREVAALERETDRRLVRVKHADGARSWEWQSIPIRLEE